MRKEQMMLERIQRMMWIPNFKGLVLMNNPVRARMLFDALKSAGFQKLPLGSVFLDASWRLKNDSLNSYVEFANASDARDFSARFSGTAYTNAWVDEADDIDLLARVDCRIRHTGEYEGWVGVVPTGRDG